MSRKILIGAALCGTVLMVAGCKTLPQHTNTLYFGTATTLGVKVNTGTPASPTPTATIGYDRIEALAMPLLANTSFDSNGDAVPCTPTQEDCKFIGKQDTNEDTYSVLATFKGNASGKASKDGGETGIGVAQYFSSGHAAIALAQNGGAAAVSTGNAATESAKASALKTYMASPEAKVALAKYVTEIEEAHSKLLVAVGKDSDTEVVRKMKAVDIAVFPGRTDMQKYCPNQNDCIIALVKNKGRLGPDMVDILASYK